MKLLLVTSLLFASFTANAMQCNDAATDRFMVEDGEDATTSTVPCTWLASRPSKQGTYCDPSHSSKAFYICQETCGACYDDCNDAPDGEYLVTDNRGIDRECSWLRGRPQFHAELCAGSAGDDCPETCGTCPNKEFDISMNPCFSEDKIAENGCSVCGDGYLAQPVDFIVPGTPATQVSCWLLQESGMLGQISNCAAIPDFIMDLCECTSCDELAGISSQTVTVNTGAPTPEPTLSPSASPSTSEPTSTPEPTTPTSSPSASPTMSPTMAPVTAAPVDPTESPTASPTAGPTMAFLNNDFFNELYRTLPDVDNEWLILGIYLSGAIVLLLVLFFFCRCCCCMCVNKRKKYAAPSVVDRFVPRQADLQVVENGSSDYSKGTDPTTSMERAPSFEQPPMPPPVMPMPDPVLDVVNPPEMGPPMIDAATAPSDVYEFPQEESLPVAQSQDYVYTSDSSAASSRSSSGAPLYV